MSERPLLRQSHHDRCWRKATARYVQAPFSCLHKEQTPVTELLPPVLHQTMLFPVPLISQTSRVST